MDRIYTKTGDQGETSLLDGTRLPKDRQIFVVLGAVDELSSLLGLVKTECDLNELNAVQNDLFCLGTELAGIKKEDQKFSGLSPEQTARLEQEIDAWTVGLPELKNFILPGGTRAGALLHQARTICRRLERELVALGRESELPGTLYEYLNRLGDWLFVAARKVNHQAGQSEQQVKNK